MVKEKTKRRTVTHDLAVQKKECENNVENTKEGKLICARPVDDRPIVFILARVCRFFFHHLRIALCGCDLNECKVESRTEDIGF